MGCSPESGVGLALTPSCFHFLLAQRQFWFCPTRYYCSVSQRPNIWFYLLQACAPFAPPDCHHLLLQVSWLFIEAEAPTEKGCPSCLSPILPQNCLYRAIPELSNDLSRSMWGPWSFCSCPPPCSCFPPLSTFAFVTIQTPQCKPQIRGVWFSPEFSLLPPCVHFPPGLLYVLSSIRSGLHISWMPRIREDWGKGQEPCRSHGPCPCSDVTISFLLSTCLTVMAYEDNLLCCSVFCCAESCERGMCSDHRQ